MSSISASTTSTTALVQTADTTGNLVLTGVSGVVDASGNTGSFNLPRGTTAQRPATLVAGAIRMSSTTNTLEYYNGTTWNAL